MIGSHISITINISITNIDINTIDNIISDPNNVTNINGNNIDSTIVSCKISTNTHTMCSGSVISTGDPSTVCTNHTRIR